MFYLIEKIEFSSQNRNAFFDDPEYALLSIKMYPSHCYSSFRLIPNVLSFVGIYDVIIVLES